MSLPALRPGLAALLLLLAAAGARADGLALLEQFVRQVQTARAEFSQVVTAPPRPGEVARTKTSSGSFELARPNRFKFVYRKPFEQTIVADGQTLWLHDVDLNQVTARAQAQVMGSTPAALVAAASDLRAVQAQFTLESAGEQDGLQWVLATPRNKDGSLQSVRVGLRAGPGAPVLGALEIVDSFGQRSQLRFQQFEANASLSPAAFVFKPPPGADVVRP